jgi:Family of unknown function (DUF6498)
LEVGVSTHVPRPVFLGGILHVISRELLNVLHFASSASPSPATAPGAGSGAVSPRWRSSGPPHRSENTYFFTDKANVDAMQFPSVISRVFPGDLVYNTPVLSLIGANLVTIIMAILGNWDLATVMFIYWMQSIIIGFFMVMSLLMVTAPPETPVRETPVQQPGGPPTIYIQNLWVAKGLLIGIFLLPYGIFHWVYYDFIVGSGIFGIVHFSDPAIWLSCSLFFANHLYSFIAYGRCWFHEGTDIVGEIFMPFRRIIPMHMTIIFGGILLLVLEFAGIRSMLPVLILFLLLKTASDVSAHIDKHQLKKSPDGNATGL